MRTQGIGEMILRLRIEKRLSQSELGRKIYNKREISRIEMEEIVPDVFALDYLLSRLGKTTDKLEYILTQKEYSIY